MNIEELEKKLYKEGAKKEEYGERPEIPPTFLPGQESKQPVGRDAWQSIITPSQKWRTDSRKKDILKRILLIVGILILIFGVFMIWRAFFAFDKTKLQLQIFGPDRIVSGENINYIVKYKNNALVGLKNASLTFELPDGGVFADGNLTALTKTVSLGEIKAQSEGQQEFQVQIMGVRDAVKKISVKLSYQPSNVKFSFENKAEFASAIISVPIVLDFDLPEKVVSGQTVNLTLSYLNTSNANFSGLKFKIEYPKGFQFTSAHPEPDEENNVWLADVTGREEGKIIISGVLSGDQNDIKSFKALSGIERNGNFIAIAETVNSSKVSVSPLNITQVINETENFTANIKENLRYKVKYQNSTDVGIEDIVITVKLESNALDYANFHIQKASFNSLTHTITWNAASLPALEFLAPHSEGEISFEINVKDKLPINDFDDKNFTITSTAKIDSPNVPLSLTGTQISGEHQLTTKINSSITLNIKGYYTDNLIANNGPLPPRVGQMTTYTIYWQILNTSNDLENVQVYSYLPSYVHWTNKFEPKNENIKYEPATGKIIWNVGNLPSATGILLPVKYAAFQVGLVPSVNQVGALVDVMQKSFMQARDLFTNMELSANSSDLNSMMPDDPTVGWEKGRVAE